MGNASSERYSSSPLIRTICLPFPGPLSPAYVTQSSVGWTFSSFEAVSLPTQAVKLENSAANRKMETPAALFCIILRVLMVILRATRVPGVRLLMQLEYRSKFADCGEPHWEAYSRPGKYG